jgi:hypothetical protein
MSKNFKILIFFALVAILTPLFLIGQGGFANVHAAVNTNPAVSSLQITAGEAGLTSGKDPIDIAATIVEFLLGFLGIIFIVLLMYGGFLRMTAQGSPEKVSTSMKIITSAVIGVFIILASWIITAFVFDQVNQQVGGEEMMSDNVCLYTCTTAGLCSAGNGSSLDAKDCATGEICCNLNP